MTLRSFKLIGGAFAAMCGLAAHAANITIADPHANTGFDSGSGSGPFGVANEDNEVESGAQASQNWDLEKFELNYSITGTTVNSATLSMTAGFNFDTGNGPYEMGDIFVYLGTTEPYTTPSPWTGKNDWDYVIRFERDFADMDTNGENGPNYKIDSNGVKYQILTSAQVAAAGSGIQYTGEANALHAGLPLRVDGNGADFASTGTALYSTETVTGDWHNTVSGIDVTSILQAVANAGAPYQFYLHTTMACGNDVMWGGTPLSVNTTSVPDGGATVLMLGASLAGLGLIRRRLS